MFDLAHSLAQEFADQAMAIPPRMAHRIRIGLI